MNVSGYIDGKEKVLLKKEIQLDFVAVKASAKIYSIEYTEGGTDELYPAVCIKYLVSDPRNQIESARMTIETAKEMHYEDFTDLTIGTDSKYYTYIEMSLQQSVVCQESELREFLFQHNIQIELHEKILKYREREYDITFFSHAPERDTEAYLRWSVGSKLFYDYTICGFLSVMEQIPYGGLVHRRPEILCDLDNLLKLNLSDEWWYSHAPYEVVAHVSDDKVVHDEELSEEEGVLALLTSAYDAAFNTSSENIVLLKNEIQIPPSDIFEINPLKYWK